MIFAVLAFLFGLLIGSFLNVCIHRMPRDLSVVRPRSRCPHCEHPIAWYDNVPLVSYALLGGRCRHCRGAIAVRYPLVELLTGAVFFYIVWRFGADWAALRMCVFSALMIGLLVTDLEERILPDEMTLGGVLAGLVFAWFVPVDDFLARALLSLFNLHPGPQMSSVAESLAGALLPAGFLWTAGFLYLRIRHKEGLGFGDVKMVATIGAFLGLRGALLVLIAGSVAGSVVGLLFILVTRKDAASYELPFGTFLGAAAIAVVLFAG
jgi:leader peptidase (prepilin peptidase) / N-methyltransferase